MKTKPKEEKSIMQQLRDIRDKIGIEIKDINHEQLREYFDKHSTLFPKTVSEGKK